MNSMRKCRLISKVEKWHLRTSGGIVAHVSSVSVTSESVSITEKIAEDSEENKIDSIRTDSKHPKPLIFLHSICGLLAQSLKTVCVLLLS